MYFICYNFAFKLTENWRSEWQDWAHWSPIRNQTWYPRHTSESTTAPMTTTETVIQDVIKDVLKEAGLGQEINETSVATPEADQPDQTRVSYINIMYLIFVT